MFGPSFENAIRYAWGRGAIPVVATGNDVVLPSGFSDEPAVVVAATDRDGVIASYSNSVGAAQWAVAAPGGEPDQDAAACQPGGSPQGIVSTWWIKGQHNRYACDAGTSRRGGQLVTAGGRVLTVVGRGDDFAEAIARAYAGVFQISFNGMQYRHDIGRKALKSETGNQNSEV